MWSAEVPCSNPTKDIFLGGEVIFTDDLNLINYVTDKNICRSSICLSFTVGLWLACQCGLLLSLRAAVYSAITPA